MRLSVDLEGRFTGYKIMIFYQFKESSVIRELPLTVSAVCLAKRLKKIVPKE